MTADTWRDGNFFRDFGPSTLMEGLGQHQPRSSVGRATRERGGGSFEARMAGLEPWASIRVFTAQSWKNRGGAAAARVGGRADE
jgi:hypothetical protein